MTGSDAQGIVAALVVAMIVGAVAFVAYYVWYSLALSLVFTKLGGESWKGWVPVLNEAEIMARGGVPAWSVVYFFIPIVSFYGLYLKVIALSRINAKFGRGVGATVLGVVLPPVWASLLAWGRNAHNAEFSQRVVARSPAPDSSVGPLAGEQPASAFVSARDASGYAIPTPAAPAASLPSEFAPSAAPAPPAPPALPALIDPPAYLSPPAPVDPPALVLPPAPVDPPALVQTPAPTFIENPWAPRVASAPHEILVVAPPTLPTPPVALVSVPVATPAALADIMAPLSQPLSPPPSQPLPLESIPESIPEPVPAPVPAPDFNAEDDLDSTVVVDRRPRVTWSLVLDDGTTLPITATLVALGRNPTAQPGAQALVVPDATRTLSKTHASLTLDDGEWSVTDLNSTNGVLVISATGVETLLDAGATAVVDAGFILGKVGMRLSFDQTTP